MALRRPKVLRIIVLDTTVSYSDIDRQLTAQIYTCFAKRGTKSNEIVGLPYWARNTAFPLWPMCYLLSHVWLFATSWTVACQVPLSMGFSRQEYWSGLPFPSPGDFLNTGIEPSSPSLQADSLYSEPPGKPTTTYHKDTVWSKKHQGESLRWLVPTGDSLLLILVDRNQNWRRRPLPSEDLLDSTPDPMGKREDNEAEIQGMKMGPLVSHTGSWPVYFCESYPVSFYLEDIWRTFHLQEKELPLNTEGNAYSEEDLGKWVEYSRWGWQWRQCWQDRVRHGSVFHVMLFLGG